MNAKRKSILALALVLGYIVNAQAQMKVANYSFGKPGTEDYEHFGFWTKDNKRDHVFYTYGKDRKEVRLQYLGTTKIKGSNAFKLQFSNKHTLYVIPQQDQLNVIDSAGKYKKTFVWEYEGPVNGIGTHCDVCAENEKEAIQLVQSSYLK